MPDLSSVAREAAERAVWQPYSESNPEQAAFVAGFTECASRLPSEAELADAISRLEWGYMVDGPSIGEISRAVSVLIGEKIR